MTGAAESFARLVALRRHYVLLLALATLGTARRQCWGGEELSEWLVKTGTQAQIYTDWHRRWGLGNPWSFGLPYLRLMSLLGALIDFQTTAGTVEIRHRPLSRLAPHLTLRVGAVEGDFQAARRSHGLLLRTPLQVDFHWTFGETEDVLQLRSLTGYQPYAGEWQPDPPERLPAVSQHILVRALAVLLSLGLAIGESPERMGRILAGTLVQPNSFSDLRTIAQQQCLALSGWIAEDGDPRIIEAEPLPRDCWTAMAMCGILPDHVGRFYNGLLRTLGQPLHLLTSAEVGYSLVRCTIAQR